MVPNVPLVPGPPLGVVPAGTVKGGQAVTHPALQALVVEVSALNLYRVIPDESVRMGCPILALDTASATI
jgi:hypothetical protein